MNSVIWIGKIVGTIAFEPIADRFGYKVVMYVVATLQCIGVTIQLVAKDWIVFSVGREFSYIAAGMVDGTVPSYQAELSPAALRGFFSANLMGINTAGNVWGAGMSRAFTTELRPLGYIIPVGVQLIQAVMMFALVPFCVESPRWLLLKGKDEAAIKALDRVRPLSGVENGSNGAEIEALKQAIEDSKNIATGTWADLFRKAYRKRSMIAGLLFFFQQNTGSQFVNSYLPTFFVSIGMGTEAFTYQTLANVAAVVGCVGCILLCDKIGRRPILIGGSALCTIFNIVIAACGSKTNPSAADRNALIASFILLLGASRASRGSLAYLMAAEVGGVRMRKKMIAWATGVDVLSAFANTFSYPYLLGSPSYWIMAGIAFVAFVFCLVIVPEIRGRSLEEVDELMSRKLWGWQYAKAETTGVGARITQLEGGRAEGKNAVGDEDEMTADDEKHVEDRRERA